MTYGDKRNYRKIDIYEGNQYLASTTWSRTCREACERYRAGHPCGDQLKLRAYFAKGSR